MVRSFILWWMLCLGIETRLPAQEELSVTGTQGIFQVNRFDSLTGTYWKGQSLTVEGSRPVGEFEIRDASGRILQYGRYAGNGFPDSVWLWYARNGICIQKDSFSGRCKWRTRFDSLDGNRRWFAKLNEMDGPVDTVFTYYNHDRVASKRYHHGALIYLVEYYPNGTLKTELLKRSSKVLISRSWDSLGKRISYRKDYESGRAPSLLAKKLQEKIFCLQNQGRHSNIDLLVTLNPKEEVIEVEVLGIKDPICIQAIKVWVFESKGWQCAQRNGEPVWTKLRIPIGFLRFY